MTKKKSKDYYLLLVTEKAQPPNIIYKWKSDFNLIFRMTIWENFFLPHSVVLESYVRAFQYKVLHNILYTNKKNIQNRFQNRWCLYLLWGWTRNFIPYPLPMSLLEVLLERFWCRLSNQQVRLSLQNVIFGIISKQHPSTKLLNYFIVVGNLFLWDCRRNQIKPKIKGYQNKIANKYETERKKKRLFWKKKWTFSPGLKSN